MNILFVGAPFPSGGEKYLILPSLEVCICSSILKLNGHNVSMLDMKINKYKVSEYTTLVSDYSPDIVCIDDEPKTHCNSVQLIKLTREIFGDKVKIVIRGEISSFVPEVTMKRNPDLDYIIRYDDDYALLNIINALNNQIEFGDIANIAYRCEGEIVVTERKDNDYELDDLPMPDREIYSIDKYLQRDSETIVRSSRGCPGKCLFCIKTKFAKFRIFSIKRFVDEIEYLLNLGFTSFFISDDTFAFSDERLEQFYNEVKKRGLVFKWTSNIRIRDINEYKLKLMKEIGAYRVFVGIETINANTSSVINKNITEQLIREKTQLLHKYDIEFHASFILGNPGDTVEDIEKTIEFVREIKPTLVTFNLIRIYPGLELYTNAKKYGMIMKDKYWYEKDEWSRKVVMGTKDLPYDVLEKLSSRCLLEFIKIGD